MFDFSLPGQPGYETELDVVQAYGSSTFDTYVPVVTVPVGTTVRSQREQVAGVFDAVRRSVPGVRVTDFASTGDERFVGEDGPHDVRPRAGADADRLRAEHGAGIVPVLERAAAAAGVQV